eukprot:6999765-Karenia_brevis.AAC.1
MREIGKSVSKMNATSQYHSKFSNSAYFQILCNFDVIRNSSKLRACEDHVQVATWNIEGLTDIKEEIL